MHKIFLETKKSSNGLLYSKPKLYIYEQESILSSIYRKHLIGDYEVLIVDDFKNVTFNSCDIAIVSLWETKLTKKTLKLISSIAFDKKVYLIHHFNNVDSLVGSKNLFLINRATLRPILLKKIICTKHLS